MDRWIAGICLAGLVSLQTVGQTSLPILKVVDQRDNQTGKLAHFSRDFIQYNNNGKEMIRVTSSWNAAQQEYIITSIAESYEDAQGRDTLNRNSYYKHYPDSLTQLVESGYTWTANGQLASLRSLFQSAPNVRNEYRVQFLRDANGCKSRDITHWYYNDVIYDETITDYTSEANCRVLVATTYSTVNLDDQRFSIIYDYKGNLLVRQRTYTLDPDSVLTSEATYQYDSLGRLTLEQLGNFTRLIFEYDGNGRATFSRTESSSDNGVTWIPAYEDLVEYNTQGQIVGHTHRSQWNNEGFYWQQVATTSTNYNEFGVSSEVVRTDIMGPAGVQSETVQETIYSYRCDGVVNNLTTTLTVDSGPEVVSATTTYQYLFPASCDPAPAHVLTIFPNPATTSLQVLVLEENKPAALRIIAPGGQLVKEFQIGFNPGIYDISDLSPGLYIVEAGTGKGSQSSRLVKY